MIYWAMPHEAAKLAALNDPREIRAMGVGLTPLLIARLVEAFPEIKVIEDLGELVYGLLKIELPQNVQKEAVEQKCNCRLFDDGEWSKIMDALRKAFTNAR